MIQEEQKVIYFARVKSFESGKTILFSDFKTESEANRWLLEREQCTDNVRTYELLKYDNEHGWQLLNNYSC